MVSCQCKATKKSRLMLTDIVHFSVLHVSVIQLPPVSCVGFHDVAQVFEYRALENLCISFTITLRVINLYFDRSAELATEILSFPNNRYWLTLIDGDSEPTAPLLLA